MALLPHVSSHPGYFGKVGMRHYHLNREAYYCPTMNLDEVWSLVPAEAQEQAAKDTTKAPVIDLTQHGVFKLLGSENDSTSSCLNLLLSNAADELGLHDNRSVNVASAQKILMIL